MTTTSDLDEAKRKLRESVETLQGASKDEIYVALVQELLPAAKLRPSPRPEAKPEWLNFWVPILFCFLVAGSSSAVLGIMGLSEKLCGLIDFSTNDRIVFLGFVVALASYVATVGRDLVRQLSAESSTDLKKTKKSIFLLVQVEAGLVFLGVFAVIFLFFADLIKAAATSADGNTVYFIPDFFLVVYLSLILLWMSFLHVRVWRLTEPWKLYC